MKANTIAFLTTSHLPFDDRIYYHMAKSLARINRVVILATTQQVRQSFENIEIFAENMADSYKKEKIEFFVNLLKESRPQCILCSESLPIIAAYKYKKEVDKKVRIIYDITEWYPSKKNLEGKSIPLKVIYFFKLLLFNLYASSLADEFIFGEYYKGLPYRIIFPFKKWKLVSYYPNLDFIEYKEAPINPKGICLGFTGKISIEKGIQSFLEVAKDIKIKRPELKVKLKIIGWFGNKKDELIFNQLIKGISNINIELIERQDYVKFSERLQDINVFFDLRKIDFENNRCLPIKLFYYMACGRPVIYSDLKAIRREIDIIQFGYLAKPDDAEVISNHVFNYIDSPELYISHCEKAREMAESTYNWKKIEPIFLNYIQQHQN